MSDKPGDQPPVDVGAEPVVADDPARVAHLAANRGLIIRRCLLSTALGGFIPLPVVDDMVSGRIRSGLYIKLAVSRHVDLPPAAAEVLAEAKGSSSLRNITVAAATLVALKLAWRKLLALLAAGRGAEEMATTFLVATLVDHYCAKLHVGGALTRAEAARLRTAVYEAISRSSKAQLVAAFKDGGRVLGRSLLEAPRWVSRRVSSYAESWVRSGGNPEAVAGAAEVEEDSEEKAWLDRAARAVENQLASLGQHYLIGLIAEFEARWRAASAPAAGSPGS